MRPSHIRFMAPLFAASALWAGDVRAQSQWSVQYTQTGNISLGLDATDANHCWIAGGTDGIGPHVGRTSDGGQTWEWVFTDPNIGLLLLDVEMVNNNVGYMGGVSVFGPGAAKTTDGGATWTAMDPMPGAQFTSAWSDFYALDEQRLWVAGFAGGFAGSPDGVALSTDGGSSFQFVESQSGAWAKSVFFVNQNVGWLASGDFPDDDGTGQYLGVIQKSTDGGATWTTQHTTNYTTYWMHFTDAQNGWVAADGDTNSIICHTSDGGATWEEQSLPNDTDLHMASVQMFNNNHGWAVGWHPGGLNPIISLYETFNGGTTWDLDPFSAPYGPVQLAMVDENTGWTVGANNMQVGAIMKYSGGSSCPDPLAYCTASSNSTGSASDMDWLGTTSVAANDLTLQAHNLPTSQFGIFFYGANQVAVPFGNGARCVGGSLYRLTPISTGGSGEAQFALDITNPPAPLGQVDPGETWNFQFWYREKSSAGGGYNFSDGLQVLFCQ